MMNDFLQLAHKIIRWNCNTLSVPIPAIRIAEPSEFATVTVKSAISNDGRELLINRQFAESKTETPFIWLVFSHECRHIWQTFNTDMFNEYKTSVSLSLSEYNAQAAEIDAWAWSIIVVSDKFGFRPTLEKNFGTKIWEDIRTRARKIANEKLF